MLNASEKIRIIAKRKNITLGRLAVLLGYSRQNLSIRLNRNTWTPPELERIAAVLGCTVETVFKDNETNETI